jgi:hypothetical protein
MKRCKINGCDSIELIHSGVDAFILGVDTETVCYNHARQLYKEAK